MATVRGELRKYRKHLRARNYTRSSIRYYSRYARLILKLIIRDREYRLEQIMNEAAEEYEQYLTYTGLKEGEVITRLVNMDIFFEDLKKLL